MRQVVIEKKRPTTDAFFNAHDCERLHLILYQNNGDPVIISRKLGHSRVSTTQDIFCHLLEQEDDTARDAIENEMFGEKKKKSPTLGKQNAR